MKSSTMTGVLRSGRFGSSVLLCALGILLTAAPGSSIRILGIAAGAVLCILGITKLLAYFSAGESREFLRSELIGGIILVLSGLILFYRGDSLLGFAGKVIGIALIITAVDKIRSAFSLKKMSFGGWLPGLITGILTAVLGIVLFTSPLGAARSAVTLIGVIVLAVGIINLISAIKHTQPEEAAHSVPLNRHHESEVIDAEYTEL